MKRSKPKRTDVNKSFRLVISIMWITHLGKTQIVTFFPSSWNCPSLRSKGLSGSPEVHQGACAKQGLGVISPRYSWAQVFMFKNPDPGQPEIWHKLALSSFTSACWSPSPTSNFHTETLWCFILKWYCITQFLSIKLNNKDYKWSKCFVPTGMISYPVFFC